MDLYDELATEKELEIDIKTIKEAKLQATDDYADKVSEVAQMLMSRTTPSSSTMFSSTDTSQTLVSERRPQFKPISDMKPFMLSTEAEPFEMRVWMGKFRSYFKASNNVQVLDLDGQKAIFKNFLQ